MDTLYIEPHYQDSKQEFDKSRPKPNLATALSPCSFFLKMENNIMPICGFYKICAISKYNSCKAFTKWLKAGKLD